MPNLKLRFDRVLKSKHKYLCSMPEVIELEHEGRTIRLMVPDDHPQCDFLVTAAAEDWLFLIGRQRPAHEESWNYAGAIVVARKRSDDVYVTELWHETYGSFLMRTGLELSPTSPAVRSHEAPEVPTALAVLPPPVAEFIASDLEPSGV
jgi:hypothetical protein